MKFALVALQYTRHKTAQQVVTGKPGYDAATLVCSQDFVSIARLYLALPDLLAQDLLGNGVTTLPQGGNKSKEVDPFGCALASCSLARNKGINKRRHDEGAEFPVMALVMKYRYQMRSQPHNIFARFVSNRSKRSQYGAVGNAQALVPDTVDEERTSNGVGTLGDFKTKNNPLSALYEVGYSKADWNALESFQKKVHTDLGFGASCVRGERLLEVHPRVCVGVGVLQGVLRGLGGLESTACSSRGGFSVAARQVICFFFRFLRLI